MEQVLTFCSVTPCQALRTEVNQTLPASTELWLHGADTKVNFRATY